MFVIFRHLLDLLLFITFMSVHQEPFPVILILCFTFKEMNWNIRSWNFDETSYFAKIFTVIN